MLNPDFHSSSERRGKPSRAATAASAAVCQSPFDNAHLANNPYAALILNCAFAAAPPTPGPSLS